MEPKPGQACPLCGHVQTASPFDQPSYSEEAEASEAFQQAFGFGDVPDGPSDLQEPSNDSGVRPSENPKGSNSRYWLRRRR